MELKLKTLVQPTQHNQDTAHLAILQVDVLLDFLVWLITLQLMALIPILVLHNHAVKLLAINLKFHFLMDFACPTVCGRQLTNHGPILQMQHRVA